MEWKKFTIDFASRSLGEYGYRYAIIDIIDTFEDTLEPLLDIITIYKYAVSCFHPVLDYRYFFHLYLAHISGRARNALISDYRIKKTAVIDYIKDCFVLWDIFP